MNCSLYMKKNDTHIMIMCIYVDDLIVEDDDLANLKHVKSLLNKEFDIKDFN